VGGPALESKRGVTGVVKVTIDSATLKQVDQQFVDRADIDAELERVLTMNHGNRIRELQPVFVRESRPRQSIGHAVGKNSSARRRAQGHARPGLVCGIKLKVA